MQREAFLKLQNGSDVRGVAIETKDAPVTLTAEMAGQIAAAFLHWLAKKSGKKEAELRIGVGHDSRLSAADLERGIFRGLSGAQVYTCGLITTPAMFLSTKLAESAFDGAIMLTASHLPFNRNGLKFFTADGGLEKGDIKELLVAAAEERLPAKTVNVQAFDLRAVYAAHLREIICRETGASNEGEALAGLHIIVDAGNGAAGFFATEILEKLGADITGSQFLDADGTFPNHVPNPEDQSAMDAIRGAVLDSNADLGIIFDCDGDRAAVVLKGGYEANRNRMIALLSAILSPAHPGATVVTDSITSDELHVFLEERLGLVHLRFQRGYKNVINKAVELTAEGTDCPLAMETSGHGALKENYYSDDGAYLSVKIVCALANLQKEGKTLADLIADLEEPADAREVRFQITEEDFAAYAQAVLDNLREYVATKDEFALVSPNYEGVRVQVSGETNGWFLLRASLHDPVMPMNVESKEEGGVAKILAHLEPFFAAQTGLRK